MDTPLENINAKSFTPHLNSKFKAHHGGAPVELELIDVEEREHPRVEVFFLHFRGPSAPRLEQQIHRLEHEKVGAVTIFLTAIEADEQGIVYEAVFNRIRKRT